MTPEELRQYDERIDRRDEEARERWIESLKDADDGDERPGEDEP